MKRIFLVGDPHCEYRVQNLIKFLIDNRRKYDFCYLGRSSQLKLKPSKRLVKRIFNKLVNKVNFAIYKFFIFWRIGFVDIVYFLPMNQNHTFELLVAKFYKKIIITDFYVSLYDTIVLDRKEFPLNSHEAGKVKKYDRDIIESSNRVIFLNSWEADRYTLLSGASNQGKNRVIIPLCVEKHASAELPFAHGKSEVPVICWWGTYIPLHGLEKIIFMARKLKERGFKFKLYVFGNSEEKAKEYRDLINNEAVGDEVIIKNDLTFLNGSLEPFLKSYADLALGNFGDSDKSKNVLVNKIVDAASMGIPVFTMDVGPINEFFDKDKDLYVTSNCPDEMANKVIEIFASRSNLLDVSIRIFNRYEEFFSVAQYRHKLSNLFDSL